MTDTEQLLNAGYEIRGGFGPDDFLWGRPDSPDLLRQHQALALVAERDEAEE